jgi:branched-chain amino acid transport system substrate-binding protein
MNKVVAVIVLVLSAAAPSWAADQVKIGFLSTLSGPAAALGVDLKDGFNLALKHAGGKLGGLPVEVIVADDQQNPETAKQLTERMLKKDNVDFMTGIVFSNVLLAVGPSIFEAKVPYISANAGPSALAGEGCNPYFFNVSWQNDTVPEAGGKYATDKGYKNVVLVSPNYPAGKDMVNGFRRYFKGAVAEELYPKLGQLDFAAELAQIRALSPDGIFVFLPGGMGINFIKQFVAAGLNKQMAFIAPGFTADEDIIRAVGEPMIGIANSSQWAHDMDNPQNKLFVADFQKEYGRLPTMYASQAYDAGQLLDSAVREVKGKIEDKEAVRAALKAAKFKSVRGDFKFNNNQFPIQSLYMRTVIKDAQGRITNKLGATIFTAHADAYASACKMK